MRRFAMMWLLLTGLIWAQQWHVSEPLPVAVAGAVAVANDTSIYLLGGSITPVGVEVSSPLIQEYSLRDGAWRCPDSLQNSCGVMQTGRKNFSAGIFNDRIYYSGGTAEFPYLFTMESWDFFSPVPASHNVNPEFNRTNANGLVYNGKYYMIGGFPASTDSLPLSYILEYDIANGTVVYAEDSLYDGQNLPYDQMIARVDDDIYIFGGTRFGVFADVSKFNTVTRKLSAATPINTVRAGGQAVAGDSGKIYIIGGYDESATALQTVDLYEISNQGAMISPAPQLNQPRHNFAAVYAAGAVYVMGGFNQFGNPLGTMERLDIATGLILSPTVPQGILLARNFPNPFNPSTTIEFYLSRPATVTLKIYNVAGQQIVETPYKATRMSAGTHQWQWDGTGNNGEVAAAGIYFYRLTAGEQVKTGKMVFAK